MSLKYSVKSPRSTRMDTESKLHVSIPTISPVDIMSMSPNSSMSSNTPRSPNTPQNDQFGYWSSPEEHFGPKSSVSFKPRRICSQQGEGRIVETTRVRKIITNSQNRYINNYLVQERIGKGSFSTVRRCKDITTGITYAMKIIRKEHLQHQLKYTRTENNTIKRSSALDLVEQEIAIMKKIQHRNIVNLVEVINTEKVLYLILEYMPYGSLAKGTARVTRLGSEFTGDDCELLRLYMRDMVSGLAYLHSQGICHCDIKPENILIGDSGVLKLADFGLSHFISPGQSSRLFSEKDGTPAFQAPECLMESEDHMFSLYPTDIWALGVTLYQVKYGYLPFFSEEEEKLMEMIKKEPVHLPTSESDQDFINLVHALLDKDPLNRITVEQLCVHPWITDRGRLEEIPYDFIRANVTEREQRKAMSRLTKMSQSEPKENSTSEKDKFQSAYKPGSIKHKFWLAERRHNGLALPLYSIFEQEDDNVEVSSMQKCNDSPCLLNDTSVPTWANSMESLVNQGVSFCNSPRVSKLQLQRSASSNMNGGSGEINTAYHTNVAPITSTWTRNESGNTNQSSAIYGKLKEFAPRGGSESAPSNIELIKSSEVELADRELSQLNVVSCDADNDFPVDICFYDKED